jgi:surface antigen
MFSVKESAAKSLMALGKSLILVVSIGTASAQTIAEPRFFNYRSGDFVNRLIDVSFGWFKTLNDSQKEAYQASIFQSLEMSENGQTSTWYRDNASGRTTPVMTWTTGSGYCRRLHVQVIAYSVEKTMAATACYDNAQENWRWMSDK